MIEPAAHRWRPRRSSVVLALTLGCAACAGGLFALDERDAPLAPEAREPAPTAAAPEAEESDVAAMLVPAEEGRMGARGASVDNRYGILGGADVGERIGTGRGGGGTGEGTVGLGNLGTIGHGAGSGGGAGYGRGAGGPGRARASKGGRIGSPNRRAPARFAATPLPQSGVLASTFVGGHGVQTRLSDLMDRGVVVDGQSVRLEAFQDRARLPYAVPSTEAVAMHAELERTRVHAEGDVVHLQIALLARQGEAPARPRLDVRLVLDRSGSMGAESKWQNAIAAAHALVDRLEPSDTFGLISYSDDASVDLPPARVGDGRRAHAALSRLRVGGGTNIEAALELARRHAPERRAASDLGLVLLVSDGRATAGVTDPRALGAMARHLFDRHGALTTTVGLGEDFDEQTMLSIAREGSGSYHFVRRPGDVSDILQDELEDRVQAVAQALRLRVELGPGVTARRVYGSRLLDDEEHAAVRATEVAVDARLARELGVSRDRQQEEERGLRIHLPTFRRGDQHVVLMELEVPGGASGGTAGVATVHLEYKDLGSRRNAATRGRVTAERDADREAVAASVRRPVKRTVLAFQAGEALQTAATALGSEDVGTARARLTERAELLEAAAALWRDDTLRADAALLRRYERVLEGVYPSWGADDRNTLVMAMGYYGDRRMR